MDDKEQSALDIFYNSLNHYDKQVYELNYLQAKELEKKQKKDDFIAGMEFIPVDPNKYDEDAEQYYNETYNIKR